MKSAQLKFFKKHELAYGGNLLKTRKGRSAGRPLDTKNTMHLVLRSTKANGAWSFRRSSNSKRIGEIVAKFSKKYGVRIVSLANVGNHLHFQIKLGNRHAYKPFIRAITAAIAMAVTGAGSGRPMDEILAESMSQSDRSKVKNKPKFWDYRPFTRVVSGLRNFLTLRDYIQINKIEGFGYTKNQARFLFDWDRIRPRESTA